MVAVAIGLGAVSSLASGAISSSGAQAAASTEAKAQQQATAAELQMFNEAQQTEAPFVSGGTGALAEIQGEQSGAIPVPGQAGPLGAIPSLTDPTQLPGYSFTLDQGLKATQNAAAAQGLGISGVALKGASTYAENLANTYYNNYLSNYWANQNNRFNQLYNLVQTGQAAAGQTAQAATTTGGQVGTTTTQTAAGQASAQEAGANTTAAGVLGAGSSATNALLANALLGQTQGGSTINYATPTNYAANYGGGGDVGTPAYYGQ